MLCFPTPSATVAATTAAATATAATTTVTSAALTQLSCCDQSGNIPSLALIIYSIFASTHCVYCAPMVVAILITIEFMYMILEYEYDLRRYRSITL